MNDLEVVLDSSFSFQPSNPFVVHPKILSALPVECT